MGRKYHKKLPIGGGREWRSTAYVHYQDDRDNASPVADPPRKITHPSTSGRPEIYTGPDAPRQFFADLLELIQEAGYAVPQLEFLTDQKITDLARTIDSDEKLLTKAESLMKRWISVSRISEGTRLWENTTKIMMELRINQARRNKASREKAVPTR